MKIKKPAARDLAVYNLLLSQYFAWYGKIVTAPIAFTTLALVAQDKYIFGYRITSTVAIIFWLILATVNAFWTIWWYRNVYSAELKLGFDLNPELCKLRDNYKGKT